MWGSSLFQTSQNWIEPDLAEGWEISNEQTSINIFLREGLKWSDGQLFTSEDVRFTYEDIYHNPDLGATDTIGRSIISVDVINEFTVRLNTATGLGTMPFALSDRFGGYTTSYQPAHYLKKWHRDYNPDAGSLAKEEGFENWYEALIEHCRLAPLKDSDKPQTGPWRLVESGETVKLLERNPYFWRVDPEGNQLPYIDRIRLHIVDPENYQLKISRGEASIAWYNTRFENLPLYRAGAQRGDYRVILYPGSAASNMKFALQGVWHKDPVIRELFNKISFRRALSVAVNRDEINKVIYRGLGVPGKVAPLPSVSFYKKGWQEDWAQYDPGLANRLLDEAGLDKKNRDGWRLLPDGRVFLILIDYSQDTWTAELELVKEYYEAVFIKTTIKQGDAEYINQKRSAGELQCLAHDNPDIPYTSEYNMFWDPRTWTGHSDVWNLWEADQREAVEAMLKKGETLPMRWRFIETSRSESFKGERPPDWWNEMMTMQNQWKTTEVGSAEYRELGQKLFDSFVEDWFNWIGFVGKTPRIILAGNKLGNVIPGWVTGVPLDCRFARTWLDQLFWKE